MKKIYLLATALAALVSCTSDEFVGDNGSQNSITGGDDAIRFGSNTGKVTRATSNDGATDAAKLDGQFLIYGVKNVSGWSKVFENYVVKSITNAQTTSNPDQDWEYVLTSGTAYGTTTTAGTTTKGQTIKYWDHAASNYHFVAGSPVNSFTFALDAEDGANKGNIKEATITGLAGHINPNTSETAINTAPVYIADPVNVPEANYRQDVTFNFVRQQSRVRVGIYETIPGYKITNIVFYPYKTNDWDASSSNNIILASKTAQYFLGGNNDDVVGKIIYDWTTTPASYTFTYEAASGKTLVQQNNWYGGLLGSSGVKAITSNHATVAEFYGTDKDMDTSSGYFTVIPTPSGTAASPLLIKCDYTLTSLGTNESGDGSGETITIHGATAAVPAAFSKWMPNTSYTYIFKISDNTNGVTSTSHTDKVGLFPITFDAVAVAEVNAQGTITTVSTPSITTYQEGSVTDKGIEYVTNKAITVTVTDAASGDKKSLNKTTAGEGYVQVYYLGETSKTEADLQVTKPTSGGISIDITDNVLSFTPTAPTTAGNTGYYAFQYQTSSAPAYAYKVIAVKAPTSGARLAK